MLITVRDDDGHLINHELQPANPKRPIYVAVGEPGHRSGVWRIWANPPSTGKSDVYVTARSIAGVQKFSLHESGDFRHQWVTGDAASRFTSSPDKRIYAWQRGPEHDGWITKGLTVFFPAGERDRITDDGSHPESTIWLPEGEPGSVWVLHIVFARPDQGEAAMPGIIPLDGFTLPNGSALMVFGQHRPITDIETEHLTTARAAIPWDQFPDLGAVQALRLTLHSEADTGERSVWEVAARRPS